MLVDADWKGGTPRTGGLIRTSSPPRPLPAKYAGRLSSVDDFCISRPVAPSRQRDFRVSTRGSSDALYSARGSNPNLTWTNRNLGHHEVYYRNCSGASVSRIDQAANKFPYFHDASVSSRDVRSLESRQSRIRPWDPASDSKPSSSSVFLKAARSSQSRFPESRQRSMGALDELARGSRPVVPKVGLSEAGTVQPAYRANKASELRRLKTALTARVQSAQATTGRPVIPEAPALLKSLPMSAFGISTDTLRGLSASAVGGTHETGRSPLQSLFTRSSARSASSDAASQPPPERRPCRGQVHQIPPFVELSSITTNAPPDFMRSHHDRPGFSASSSNPVAALRQGSGSCEGKAKKDSGAENAEHAGRSLPTISSDDGGVDGVPAAPRGCLPSGSSLRNRGRRSPEASRCSGADKVVAFVGPVSSSHPPAAGGSEDRCVTPARASHGSACPSPRVEDPSVARRPETQGEDYFDFKCVGMPRQPLLVNYLRECKKGKSKAPLPSTNLEILREN